MAQEGGGGMPDDGATRSRPARLLKWVGASYTNFDHDDHEIAGSEMLSLDGLTHSGGPGRSWSKRKKNLA